MDLVGKEIKHKKWGNGIVTAVLEKDIEIKFNDGMVKSLGYPSSFYDFKVIELVDLNLQEALMKELSKETEPINVSKSGEETEDQNSSKGKAVKIKDGNVRKHGEPMIFLVSQGDTYENESVGGYIWAPVNTKKGTKVHHWERMEEVCAGDVIIHAANGYIMAISYAKGACYSADRPGAFDNLDQWDKDGRKVDCDYHCLKNPIGYAAYREEFKKYSSTLYSPFNNKGNINQGYLFECPKDIAKMLIAEAKKYNSDLVGIFDIK